ncbi:hypothetical protein CN178_21900 [Sinorhizobium medicae]|nr:hypothetical protein CN178_21900 [Sinorhizobium medicae]
MAGNRPVKKRHGGERCAADRAEDKDSFAPWTLLRSLGEASNSFELAVAAAICLFGFRPGAAL